MVVIQYRNTRKLLSSTYWVEYAQKALAKISGIESSALHLQTAQRGYLLTSQEEYLEHYYEHKEQLYLEIEDLEVFTADNPVQTDRVAQLENFVNIKVDYLEKTIELAQQGKLAESTRMVNSNEGLYLMDSIVSYCDLLREEEKGLLATRSEIPEVEKRNSDKALMTVVLINIILVVLVVFEFRRSVLRPVTDFNDAVHKIGTGKTDYRLSVNSNDEMGELAHSFNAMLDSLSEHMVSIDRLEIEIAARKQTEKELNELNKKLKGLNKKLRQKEKRLNASIEDLNQFAYIASHDLKEPLRQVASYTQLIMRKYTDLLDEKGQKYANYVVDGSKRMQRLIDDILVFSRTANNPLELETFNVSEMLHQVLDDLHETIESSGAQVLIEGLPENLYADQQQINRVFANIIGNALKYKREAVAPEIRISSTENKTHSIFSIEDNGIGISESFAPKVFQMFQRQFSRDRYEGTGIGLAVVKKIIQRHNGDIRFESKTLDSHGQTGTIFYFSIATKDSIL